MIMDDQKEKKEVEGKGAQEAQKSLSEIQNPPQTNTEGGRTNTAVDSDLPLLDRAKRVTDEMRRVNAETQAILDRREKLMAEEMIEGRAMAGLIKKDEEVTPEQYAKDALEGKIQMN